MKRISSPLAIFVLYTLILVFLAFGDSLMSYVVPAFLTSNLHSTFLMGLVFSTSSAVGLLFDFFAGDRFRTKSYKFFLKLAVMSAILFPIILLVFPKNPLFFVLAMSVWGIYYELIAFSDYNFVHLRSKPQEFSRTWGIFSTLFSLAYLVGPLVCVAFLDTFQLFPMFMALGVFLIALLIFLFYTFFVDHKMEDMAIENKKKTSVFREFKVWRVLISKVWVISLFYVSLVLIDSAFWSIGIVFAEQLKEVHPLGKYFVIAYVFPTVVFSLLVSKITGVLGKKRTAFIFGLLGGLVLSMIALFDNVYLIILFVFASSVFTSVAFPALRAAYEDYISRLGSFGNDFVGLEQAFSSVAYIVGPILAGGLSALFGDQRAFFVLGLFLAVVSVFALVVVPRKIRMPHKELEVC